MSYQIHSGGVYQIKYHFVWCPKYGRPVLVGPVASRLRKLFHEKATQLGGSVLVLEIEPDHFHLLVEMLPRWSPVQVAYRIKDYPRTYPAGSFPGSKVGYAPWGVAPTTSPLPKRSQQKRSADTSKPRGGSKCA